MNALNTMNAMNTMNARPNDAAPPGITISSSSRIQRSALTPVANAPLGGSTGAIIVEYNGARYVLKTGSSEGGVRHAINEYIAFKLYALVGARVPRAELVYDGTEPSGILLEYILGQTPEEFSPLSDSETTTMQLIANNDYIVHALFANRDAINPENYIVPLSAATGTYDFKGLYILDLGGALFYRSKGAEKGLNFTDKTVPEVDSLAAAAAEYGSIFFSDLNASASGRHRIICQRWQLIDSDEIIRFLESPDLILPLLEKYDMTSLVRTMKRRIAFINEYCSRPASLSQSLSAEELSALVAEIDTMLDDRGTTAAALKARIGKNIEVLALPTWEGDPPLIHTIYMEPRYRGLFFDLVKLAKANADILNSGSRGSRGSVSLIRLAQQKKDYEALATLIIAGARLDSYELGQIDLKRLFEEIGRQSPRNAIVGRLRIAEWEPVSPHDIIPLRTKDAANEEAPDENRNVKRTEFAKPDTALDKTVLLPKPVDERIMEDWKAKQARYLNSSPRITAIVRAYTYRGDRLANSYLRGTLTKPYDMLNALRDDSVIPFAYQIYDNYDYLKRQGLTMPPRETLMEDRTINDAAIKALYIANFDYFLRLHNIHKLMKDYCRDLLDIIKRAPRAPMDMLVYRGVENELHLKTGTIDYVNNSFQSTSINPYSAVDFTKHLFDTPIRFSIYEMKLPYGAPCLFIDPVSRYKEHEILLPYNIRFTHSVDISLKYLRKPLVPITPDMHPDTLERVFVRGVTIHGFSGRMEPVVAATRGETRRKTKRLPRLTRRSWSRSRSKSKRLTRLTRRSRSRTRSKSKRMTRRISSKRI